MRLVKHAPEGYRLQQEDRSNVGWLVARNYRVRFDATIKFYDTVYKLAGVFLTVEAALLPIDATELSGYSHGVVSVYDQTNTQAFSGPHFNPVEGAVFEDGTMSDYWTRVTGAWAGENLFAGSLLRVDLQGRWQDVDGETRLVEEGDVLLIRER